MKVETKFSIGDTVWYEEYDNDSDTFIPEELKIKYIQVVNWKENSFDITYFGKDMYGLLEEKLFATKDECQKACDEINKMGRR